MQDKEREAEETPLVVHLHIIHFMCVAYFSPDHNTCNKEAGVVELSLKRENYNKRNKEFSLFPGQIILLDCCCGFCFKFVYLHLKQIKSLIQ